MKSFLVGGKASCVSSIDGKLSAISNVCTHAGGGLSNVELEGKAITCPNHGAKFDVPTGQCIAGPRIDLLRGKAKDETVYEVKIEDNRTRIAMV